MLEDELNLTIDTLPKWLALKSLGLNVDSLILAEKVQAGTYHGITTEDLFQLASETAATLITWHPDWSKLGARILLEKLYRSIPLRFSEAAHLLYEEDPSTKRKSLLSDEVYDIVNQNRHVIDNAIKHENDRRWDYFGLQTLMKSYLLRCNGQIAELPQHLLMRVALGIHGNNIPDVLKTYNLMSEGYFIHATPTLFNAGTRNAQMASCYILCLKEDSVEGIFDTLKQCALISKYSGGIGLHISNVRSVHSYIAGTGGFSGGVVPMLRMFNNAARFIDQGGAKRPGALSITLEPWHADILDFLDLGKNHGKEELRARDLFYALWVPDLFMKKVDADEEWYLFSPDTAPYLNDCVGEEFDSLYSKYVAEKRFRSKIPARKLWYAILDAQIETGNPSILYKDAANERSNQKNLGVIKSSNLCTEIIEYSSPGEIAVCNLASIALPRCINNGVFDYEKLHDITRVITRNLNIIIDKNLYPLPEAESSNKKHRPIAIGVQGLSDAYQQLGFSFDSVDASKLNTQIFETIYHGAITESLELAKCSRAYSSFQGSPMSEGKFQFDLWGVTPTQWDWETLRKEVKKYGLANSLLTAVMPTASTSQILGNTESVEPLTSNIFSRRTLSGEYQILNSLLVSKLEALNLWNSDMRQRIMAAGGSIQEIPEIPEDVRRVFRTAWEISQKHVIDQAKQRAPFVDQSQSMNIFMATPTKRKLSSMHFYGWKAGLKTGLYYLRTQPAALPIPFTLDHQLRKRERSSSTDDDSDSKRMCDMCAA